MVDFAEHIKPAPRDLWIYFLGVDGRFVKIGKSAKARGVRLAQHRKPTLDGHSPDVVLLCEVRGCDADERALHRHFAHLRDGVGVEMFRADKSLIDYVRWLRDEWFASVPEDSDEFRDALPMVDADAWMPRDGRAKRHDPSILPGMFPPFDLPPRVITKDDFYTSPRVIEAAREAMGSIDLDPATHAQANRVVRASRFFTAQTNGLQQQWSGNVWLNPPFSKWAEWTDKIIHELESGRVRQLCALAATRTITAKYFSPLMERCDAICVFRGRIPFWGGRSGAPDEGHVVLYFGDRQQEFRSAFLSIGVVFPGSKVCA